MASAGFMWWSALVPEFGEAPRFDGAKIKSSLFQQNAWKFNRRRRVTRKLFIKGPELNGQIVLHEKYFQLVSVLRKMVQISRIV